MQLWGGGQRWQGRGSWSQPGGDLSSPTSGPVTRHILAGSQAAEPLCPGSAGPRRLRPPASTPSCPVALGAAQTRGAGWGFGVPTWLPGTQRDAPLAPRMRVYPPNPHPVALWDGGHLVGGTTRARPHCPHGPWGPCSSIPSRPAPAQTQRLHYALRPQTVRCQWLPSLLDRSSLAPLPPSRYYNGTPRAGAAPAGTAVPAAAAPSPSC